MADNADSWAKLIEAAGPYILALVTIGVSYWQGKKDRKHQYKQGKKDREHQLEINRQQQDHDRNQTAREEERKLSIQIAELLVKITASAHERSLSLAAYNSSDAEPSELKEAVLKDFEKHDGETVRENLLRASAMISLIDKNKIKNHFEYYEMEVVRLFAIKVSKTSNNERLRKIDKNIKTYQNNILSLLAEDYVSP